MKKNIVVWFSCGAASAVAAKRTIEFYGKDFNVIIANTYIKEEDIDNTRFLKDVEKWIGQEIIDVKNPKWNSSIVEVFDKRKYMGGVKGAPCTGELKKEARYYLEKKIDIAYHVLGYTLEEKERHERFVKYERENLLPVLIDLQYTKEQCFEIISSEGIVRPIVYDKGFPNANCIGCVKATSPTYWNLVRKEYPEVFDERAEQSRRIGARLVRVKGERIFLDELNVKDKGHPIKSWECNLFCNKY